MNNVVVKYNPYVPELKILVNGMPLSRYSSLNSYEHREIFDWCDILFSELYKEINSPYELDFYSGEIEGQIIEKIGRKYSFCKNISVHGDEIYSAPFERLKTLQKFSDGYIGECHFDIFCENDEALDSIWEDICDDIVFSETDNENVLSSDLYPGIDIELEKKYSSFYCEGEYSKYTFPMLLTTYDDENTLFEKFEDSPGYVFIIRLCGISGFDKKIGNALFFDIEYEKLPDKIFELISSFMVSKIIGEKIYDVISSQSISVNELTELRTAVITYPVYDINFPEKMYCGSRKPVTVSSLPFQNTEYCILSSDRFIAEPEEMYVRGKNRGCANIMVKNILTDEIVGMSSVTIMDGVLIENIEIFPHILTMPAVSSKKPELKYSPSNAVNVSEITWQSSDENIAFPLDDGTIRSKNCGSCFITVSAGYVSKKFKVEVQESITSLSVPFRTVNIKVGETIQCKYTVEPVCCYERDLIKIANSDSSVASYNGGYIRGLSVGITTLTIYIPGTQIKQTIKVSVFKKSLFGKK